LVVDPETSTVSAKVTGVKINPGGIGKGYALDQAGRCLTSAGIADFMMHGGLSSIITRGRRLAPGVDSDWMVALKHPFRWEEIIETFPLRDAALATSGSGKQFFHFGGKRYSHLIDPRTGWPADQMMSSTVICPSAAVADALSTAMFIMGVQASSDFCDRFPSIAALLIYQDPKSGSQRTLRKNWRPLTD
jgi:thiamine biosynthesis lipoprotein